LRIKLRLGLFGAATELQRLESRRGKF
jgi:hypothetical protein